MQFYRGGGGISSGHKVVQGKFRHTSSFAEGPSDMGNFNATGDAQRAGNAPNCAKKIRGENFDAKPKNKSFATNLSLHEMTPHPCTMIPQITKSWSFDT